MVAAPSCDAMQLTAHGVTLEATLDWPEQPRGIVLFAHGSGSSRSSPRNRLVAEGLHGMGLASLLLDLLTPEEGAADQIWRPWLSHGCVNPRCSSLGGRITRCLPSTRRLRLPFRPPTAWPSCLVQAISLKNPVRCSV
ncbi:MAG: hypothetical protein ACK59G_13605 [Cyanobacteriota bacterium]|jgi:hypothetical protein